MHAAVVAPFTQALVALAGVLDKGASHAAALKIEPTVLLNARLYPDMFPLVRQVQIACDMVKGGVCRIAGQEIPSHPDTETTFEQLRGRIDKVVDLARSIPPAAFDGAESRPITIKVAGQELHFTGQDYLLRWLNPNIYFHLTTAYAILRHNGVPVGKGDYLGRP
jgi:hypothetical protein